MRTMTVKVLFGSLLLSFTALLGQSTISGRIVDAETGQPLVGANVVLEGADMGARSDLDGNYLITGVAAGRYRLAVTYIGYTEEDQSFTIRGNLSLVYDFSLQPAVLAGETVVVTGSRVGVALKNVPLTISVISEDEIRQSSESALLPVLSERVPGVFVTERGVTGFGVADGAAGMITVRGVGGSPNTQVLVLIDGSPQFAGIFGHPLPDAYVASDVERIEVVRGPASILYGSGAMAGVVNIITKEQKADGLRLNGQTTFGSFNTQKYMASGGYRKDRLELFASINHDQTDGHRPNSEFEINNGYIKAGYAIGPHLDMSAGLNLVHFETNDPGHRDSTWTQIHWLDITRGAALLSIDNDYDKIAGGLKLFYNYGEHNIWDGFHSTDVHRGLSLYQGLSLIPNNTITVGIDYSNYGGKAENVELMMGQGVVFADTSVNEAGVYAFVQQILREKLMLNAGLRLENHSQYGLENVPQVGLAYNIGPTTTIKGSVSKGFRSPSIRNLFLWWPSSNPDLEPERMWNYEFGMMQYLISDRLRLDVTGFVSVGDNLIQMKFAGEPPFARNTGEFNHRGVELQSNYLLSDNVSLNANYSYLNMEEPVTAAPEHQLFVESRFSHGIFNLSTKVQYIGNVYTYVSDNLKRSQEYTLLSAKLTITPLRNLTVFITGENLLDQTYEINDGYPMPGITVFGGINLQY